MKKIIFAFFFCLFNFSSLAFDNPKTDFIIAKVNNKAITNSELSNRYNLVLLISKMTVKSEVDKQMLREQILDKMVDEELIRQEAQSLKIEVAPQEIREAVDILAARQKLNATQLKVNLSKKGVSFDNYLKQIEAEILWSKTIANTLKSKVKVTDVEIKEFFEENKFDINVKKFLLAEIFIPKSDNGKQLAEKLVLELRNGADFNAIVQQFSRGLNVENNGELGWLSSHDLDKKIYNILLRVNKGGYSDAINLPDGFHIFKVIDIKTETHIANQDMEAARNAIFAKKLQSLAKGYLLDLRKKSFIEIEKK